MSNSIKEQLASTPLFGANASAVEKLYEQYLEDPEHAFPGRGHRREPRDELSRLRREVEELRRENEFLKKTKAFMESLPE